MSPRFLLLGGEVEVEQVGPDSFEDTWTDAEIGGKLTARRLAGYVRITLPGQDTSYETTMPWPAAGDDRVELAPAVLEALDHVDPHASDNVLRALRDRVEEFLAAEQERDDMPVE